ncbi:MAG: hypothetical protein ACXAC5_05000 [Promethearchaeota archaeon]|jgi:hypothetical protein
MPGPGSTVLELNVRSYNIVVYVADRIAHDEPLTLAWEVTEPKSENPHRILLCSKKDFEYIGGHTGCIQAPLQDAISTLSGWIRKNWPKVEAL